MLQFGPKIEGVAPINMQQDVSPKAVAYLLVPPPQSLAQIAALHPNIWLSYPAKMASQYMGFMQLDYPIAGYRAM